jgi:hypothetical protein
MRSAKHSNRNDAFSKPRVLVQLWTVFEPASRTALRNQPAEVLLCANVREMHVAQLLLTLSSPNWQISLHRLNNLTVPLSNMPQKFSRL